MRRATANGGDSSGSAAIATQIRDNNAAIASLRAAKNGALSTANASMIVNFNITTADADSFRKSETQVTAMLARAVGRGRRGL